ncbi:hypothetical protein KCA24_36585, partial [Escherichia coli]|nr:hypothetical protein [Escherichia coli]
MASLFEPDVPEVVSGEDVTQAEKPQHPGSPAVNDKNAVPGVSFRGGGGGGGEKKKRKKGGKKK